MSYKISLPDGNGARRITLDGYLIPNITVRYIEGSDKLSFVLDERLGFTVAETEDLELWLTFIANAMAVAASKSCFGENSSDVNLFKIQSFEISRIESDDNETEDDEAANISGDDSNDSPDIDDIWRNALE